MKRYPLTACALQSAAAIVSCLIRSTLSSGNCIALPSTWKIYHTWRAIFVAGMKWYGYITTRGVLAGSIFNSLCSTLFWKMGKKKKKRSFSSMTELLCYTQRKLKMYRTSEFASCCLEQFLVVCTKLSLMWENSKGITSVCNAELHITFEYRNENYVFFSFPKQLVYRRRPKQRSKDGWKLAVNHKGKCN